MTRELKDCPYCGGTAELLTIGNYHTKKKGMTVKCTKCYTEQTTKAIKYDFDWLENTAVEKWNKRANEAELKVKDERIAELEAMVQKPKAKSKVKTAGIKCPFKLYRSMDNCGACLHAYSHFWDSETKLCTPKPKDTK